MASFTETTCPECGGQAVWTADDNVTYCQEPAKKDSKTGKWVKCNYFGIEDCHKGYKPQDYRSP